MNSANCDYINADLSVMNFVIYQIVVLGGHDVIGHGVGVGCKWQFSETWFWQKF